MFSSLKNCSVNRAGAAPPPWSAHAPGTAPAPFLRRVRFRPGATGWPAMVQFAVIGLADGKPDSPTTSTRILLDT